MQQTVRSAASAAVVRRLRTFTGELALRLYMYTIVNIVLIILINNYRISPLIHLLNYHRIIFAERR